jgi:hypothetical protein
LLGPKERSATGAEAAAVNTPAPTTVPEAVRYSTDIFLSYKQNDGSDALAMALYHELKPLDVWLDKKRGAERSEAGMMAGVQGCRLFCAILSPLYFGSQLCLLEIRKAIVERKKIVLCLQFGSKFKVQEALGWLPVEFSGLKSDELVMLHEDDDFMQVTINKLRSRAQ